MSAYSINATAQFMENHLAAQPLAAQSALAIAKTTDHQAIMFSIDDSGIFRATIGQDDHETGWETLEIGTGIPAAENATVTAKLFDATQATNSGMPGDITIAIAVTQTSGDSSYDQVFITTLSSDAKASWISDPSTIVWTERAFDFYDSQKPQLVASTLSIAEVYLAIVSGSEPFAAITVVDPGNKLELPFEVSLEFPAPSQIWTYLIPEQDYDTLLGSDVGQPQGTVMPGIYKLYSQTIGGSPQVSLTFKPRSSQFPARFYQVSNEATAIAAVALQEDSGNSFTTLLVADGGNLVLFPAHNTSQNDKNYFLGTIVASNPSGQTYLSDVTHLHAVSDGSLLSIWGVNQSGQAFHLSASIAQDGSLSNWSTPLPLLSNVKNISPYLSENRQLKSLFAVISDPITEEESLVHLATDASGNGSWNQTKIHLPSTNAYVSLKTYTTRLQVTQPDANGYQKGTNATVQITPSNTVTLQVNGRYSTVSKDNPLIVDTDASGAITIMQNVHSLGAPSYSFSVVDDSITDQSPKVVDPTQGVRDKMTSYKTGSDLQNVKITNGQGQTQSLLNSNVSDTTADSIASGIQNANSVVSGASKTGQSHQAIEEIPSDWILAEIGDLVQAVGHGFEDAVAWIVQAADDVWHLAVKIGESVFHAIIAVAEDVANCACALFNAVLTVFEDLYHWLAFLFDWDNILTIQKQLVSFYKSLLDSAGEVSKQALVMLGEWIVYYGDMIKNDADKLTGQIPDNSPTTMANNANNSQTNTGQSPGLDSTDPRVHWGQSHFSGSNSGSQSNNNKASLAAKARHSSSSPRDQNGNHDSESFSTAVDNLGGGLLNLAADFSEDLVNLIDGNDSLREVVGNLLGDLGTIVVDTGEVVEAAGPEVNGLISDFSNDINTKLEIPLLTALFEFISDGEDLTILNLICLLQAVPTALMYDIATNGNGQAADFLTDGQISSGIATLNQSANKFPSPPKSDEELIEVPKSIAGKALSEQGGDQEGDGYAGTFRMILGGAYIGRLITTVLLNAAEKEYKLAKKGEVEITIGEAIDNLSAAYRTDSIVWAIEGILELICDHESASDMIIGGANTGLGILNAAICNYTTTRAGADQLPYMRGIFSAIIGVGEAVAAIAAIADGGEDTAEIWASAAEIAYGVNEIAELVEVNVESQAEKIIAFRCVLMAGSAVAQIVSGGLEA
ncbi:hypothetical protein JMN32_25280 [Fulvivirga sp. 29W222]|uniref:Uncharacterized protein n=1 Tax=Fulvivirga marina TaxID=2494733 RepID=A0A937G432_9BACT|nr:hypothetical protein [Fulvivirga marina]MBL6449648.1 hypothetical protein [Fulvivirga marina]